MDALDMDCAFFYVALAADRVAGYIGIYLAADEGEIANVAVAPAYRRKKIATTLVCKALAQARAKGAAQVFLEVRESNAAAISLYQSAGFQTVGKRKDYYQRPVEDALLMRHSFPIPRQCPGTR